MFARIGILWLRFRAWLRAKLYALRVRLFGRLAVEAATEGRTAIHAVDMDSPEGDIQAASQRAAWTTQISRLEAIDARNRDQEYLLRQLRRNVRDLDAREARAHATPAGLGGQRLATFGAVGQQQSFLSRMMYSLAPIVPYLLIGGLFMSVTGWETSIWNGCRADRLEAQRDIARAEHDATERDLLAATAERDLLRDAAAAADAQSQQAAQTIEAERARRLRAEREARRIRDAMDQARAGGSVDYGFGGVRDDQPPN